MANKTYQGRIVQKHDSSANWAKATNFIPLKGEIIIYDDLNKIKIGDGTTKVNDLDFSSSSGLPEGGTAGDTLVKDTDGGSWETPVEATLVSLPTGILKSDGTTISQAIAGIDYMSNIEGNFVTYKSITETENTTSINANTLDGHGSNYYATANSVTTLGDRVTTNETNISSLQENIANINVVPTNHSETVLTSQDLNNYNTLSAIGWYYAAGDNTVVNKPSGVDAFGLEVGRSATGWFYQILKSSNQNTNKIYIRNYDSSIATWSNWSRLVSDSELPPTPKTYSGILSSNSWATSGNYKTQTITIPGLRSSYSSQPIIDAQLSGTDADGDNAVLDAWSAVNYANTATNSLTAMCIGDAPEVNIPILINVME